MKSLLGFLCVILAGLLIGSVIYIGDTQVHVNRWKAEVQTAANYREMAREFLVMKDYTTRLVEAVRMQASENGILCEREAKMVQVVSEFEAENRRLKESLKEAVERLQEQEEQINDLMDSNERYSYQVRSLERQVESLEKALEAIEEMNEQVEPEKKDE